VTREEIACMERTLSFIDLKNSALANVSRWLLVWEGMRDLCHRYGLSPEEIRVDLADDFKALIKEVIKVGMKITELVDDLEIDSAQFLLATGCDSESVSSCIAFLENKIVQWFEPEPSEEIVSLVMESLRDESIPVV